MSCLRRKSQLALAACLVAAASFSAQAEIVLKSGVQEPTQAILDGAFGPPTTLSASIQAAQALFTAATTGRVEFESGVQSSNTGLVASYVEGVGSASLSSGATLVNFGGATSDLGRYNTTPNLASADGGNWIEAQQSFTVSFSEAVSAFSFFVTDLGDFDGQVFVELYAGAPPEASAPDTSYLFREELMNNAGVSQDALRTGNRTGGNGNLLYAGITSSTAGITFKSARFVVVQCTPNTQLPNDSCDPNFPDIIGFDSLRVGNYNGSTGGTPIPEPTSLALVGLGLLAAGWSRKAKRAA